MSYMVYTHSYIPYALHGCTCWGLVGPTIASDGPHSGPVAHQAAGAMAAMGPAHEGDDTDGELGELDLGGGSDSGSDSEAAAGMALEEGSDADTVVVFQGNEPPRIL